MPRDKFSTTLARSQLRGSAVRQIPTDSQRSSKLFVVSDPQLTLLISLPRHSCGGPDASVVARNTNRLRRTCHNAVQILPALNLLDIVTACWERGEARRLFLICKIDDNQTEGVAHLP
jgi:hypothetical protein